MGTAGHTTGSGGRPTEAETTLVILADPPEPLADAVAALTELDGFSLLHAPDVAIRDRYFDTAGGDLAARGVGLRLRQLDERRLLTIKGPPREGRSGVPTREELEEPWPEPAWALLRSELDGTLAVPAVPPASDPAGALGAIGLELVQDRRTARRLREVLPPAGGRASVAELAIDAVTYDLDGRAVRHHELELESRADDGEDVVAVLTERLLDRYAAGLCRWSTGKLATGRALAAFIASRGADAVLDREGRVRPAVYLVLAGGAP